jgi:C4-dicarboxylate transporter
MRLLNFLLSRAKEASTWRGATVIATTLGVALSPALSDAIILAGSAVFGLIEVIRSEKK